jgi:multisubunit Na+/H+ antiporter MnhE subunit
MNKLKHVFNQTLFLFAVWLLLSGHYTPLLLVPGVLSTLLVVFLATRAELIDREIIPNSVASTSWKNSKMTGCQGSADR